MSARKAKASFCFDLSPRMGSPARPYNSGSIAVNRILSSVRCIKFLNNIPHIFRQVAHRGLYGRKIDTETGLCERSDDSSERIAITAVENGLADCVLE